MSEITAVEAARRAMEAQARATGKIDVAAVEAAIADGDPIPSDESEVELQQGQWREQLPEPETEPESLTHEQPSLLDGELPVIRYENLLPEHDVQTYKRVKRWTMNLAHDARAILADLVGGTVGDGGRSRKEFLQTPRGSWRVSMGSNSDNTTERAAHERMGVKTLHLDEQEEVLAFLEEHGLPPRVAYEALVRRLRGSFREG